MAVPISKIDKNFSVPTSFNTDNLSFFSALDKPFKLYGLFYDNGYRRMPLNTAMSVSEGVGMLSSNTSGGRLRFLTDSNDIAIKCTMPSITHFPHMPLTGVAGFDLYADGRFTAMFTPPVDTTDGFESLRSFNSSNKKMRLIEINFPLYNDVSELYIGLEKNASMYEAPSYRFDEPILFYGSSITQGGCASRPGLAYQNVISRRYNVDIWNLGFSGNAHGEAVMAEYISGLKMKAFVMDYDHNASTPKQLFETHKTFFEIIRQKNASLPIVFVSKPDIKFTPKTGYERRDIILDTYQGAVDAGDKNVYFVDGEALWGTDDWDSCTVDGCHPNDIGFERMANLIGKQLAVIID